MYKNIVMISVLLVCSCSLIAYSKNICKPFRVCTSCIDDTSTLKLLNEFTDKYGSRSAVFSRIMENHNRGDDMTKLYPRHFYDKFGPYLLLFLPLKEKNSRYIVMEHLLSMGVHPYDRLNGSNNIADSIVSLEDVRGVKILSDSNMLLDCKSKLNELIVLARKIGNLEITEMLEQAAKNNLNSYHTCAGTCGCPPTMDTSVSCPTTTGDCKTTSTKCTTEIFQSL